jgi:hypothetical protein
MDILFYLQISCYVIFFGLCCALIVLTVKTIKSLNSVNVLLNRLDTITDVKNAVGLLSFLSKFKRKNK